MLATLKSLVATLAMPFPAFLGLVGLAILMILMKRRRAGSSALFGAILLLTVAAWGPVAEPLLASLENRHAAIIAVEDLGEVAAVVVLGGGRDANPQRPVTAQLTESSALRLLEGLRLLQALPDARLIVSGASRQPERPPVARAYAQAARELGVSAERITVLDTPTDTAQEARAVATVLNPGQPFLLVTSASHMARAIRHFQWVGLDPLPAPTHYLTGRLKRERLAFWIPSADHLRKTERAIYEYLGLLALRWDH